MRNATLSILTGICVVLVMAGAAVLVGVWAVPQWDAYRAETQVASMQASSSSSSSTPAGQAQIADAHNYNSALAGEGVGSQTPYDRQLNLIDAQAIGWIDIPSINVKRPVYHYDSEEVLMVGVGHIEGTSLPVGGASTHCCVTGHSGMPGSRMFDDLEKMEIGDVFVFWTLGDPYAYRVYDIEVVEPSDTSSLRIQRGRDLATLITCTPYGVNSHRLLVHGERTDYVPEEIASAQAHPTSDRLWALAAGVVAAVAATAALLYLLLGGGTLELIGVLGVDGAAVWQGGGVRPGFSGAMMLRLKPLGRAVLQTGFDSYAGRWRRAGGSRVVELAADGLEVSLGAGNAPGPTLYLGSELVLSKVDGQWEARVPSGESECVLKLVRR